MVVKAKSSTQKSESKRQGNIYDAFAKQMLRQVLVFADFLQNYADPKFVSEITPKKIRLAPTHYFSKDGKEQILDLAFYCPLKSGKGNLMAVIIFEHQSGSIKKIPQKLLRYISAIWDAEMKDGKPLSAPYFIILRTGKKPHRGRLPKMSDLLPKGKDGKPLGKAVEIEYDIVDLPAWDFDELVGGPVLRLTLGMLHMTAGGNIDDLPVALRPILEIDDPAQRIDLGKDVLPFAAKVFAANNRRFDEAQMDEVLKPIFTGEERAMIKTIFEEREDIGELKASRNLVLTALRRKFKKIPKKIEKAVLAMSDTVALESMLEHVIDSNTLDEFATVL